MSFQTNPLVIRFRNGARKLGLTRYLSLILQGRNYEKAFDDAMFGAIKVGDTVWDVGANVGYYTRRFAEAVMPGGSVFAFEPFPATVERLRSEVGSINGVSIISSALGSTLHKMSMQAGGDSLGATNRLVDSGAGHVVQVSTGDCILSSGVASIPNIIKIDTEGFELDVLMGMSALLEELALRAVFIEVHFGILSDRGMRDAPGEIENLLKAKGFSLRWVDPSHLAAYRR